jgi:peptidoglycan/xylan/chitin deacetylase (PgdA/CDA1 family)
MEGSTVSSLSADPRDRVPYLAMPDRPAIEWPGGARLALWVSPNVEHYEYQPPANSYFNHYSRVPDVQQYGFRDYGNRVGFWRMLDLFADLDIKPTASLNLEVLALYPQIRDAMREHQWAIMSHGNFNTRPVYGFDESQERSFFERSLELMDKFGWQPLRGMLGPALSMTSRTPDLMAEYGLLYSTDWPHDEQPVPIRTEAGKLVSVPYSYDINDGGPFPYTVSEFMDHARRQFDRLWRDGESSGRVMCIALHPFLMGQPHGIVALRELLEYIKGHDGVWYTTADEIAQYYIENCRDAYLAAYAEVTS